MKTYVPGDLIANRYEVASRPMPGGMGIVYICLDHEQDRPVALKTFRPEYLPDRAARDRFLREGTIWVNLGSHPHIVRCYEVIRDANGLEIYLALELIAKEQGREDASLRSWLFYGCPLRPETALLFALQIARGMQYAVERIPGFVHRDLKPENVLVGADRLPGTTINRLRVTDFGLAKIVETNASIINSNKINQTDVGQAQFTQGAGTKLYMSPEQWQGAPVGVYTDVYALGCILYEMFTGYTAAPIESWEALEYAHRTGNLRPLPESIPAPVRYILQRCLALDPGDRYTDWESLEFALASAYAAIAGCSAPSPRDATALSLEEYVQVGWSYNVIGTLYLDIGKAEVALGFFEQALTIAHNVHDRYGQCASLSNLGIAYKYLGDTRRAIGYYEQALAIDREIGDRRGESMTLDNLGSAYSALCDVHHAIEYHEQALTISLEISDRRGESASLLNLGAAYEALGNVHRAIEYYEQVLLIDREIGDRRGEGISLSNLGNAYTTLGNIQYGINCYEQALLIHREIGNRRAEGITLGNLGNAYAELGNTHHAISYYEQNLAVAREIGDLSGEGRVLSSLGSAYIDLGNAQRALDYYESALTITRETEDRRWEEIALGGLGNAYSALGNSRQAIVYYEQALVIDREIGDRYSECIDLWNLADELYKLGNHQQAIAFAEVALEICNEIGSPIGNTIIRPRLAVWYMAE